MPDENPDIAEKLAALKLAYVGQLGERIGLLESACAEMSSDSDQDQNEKALEDLMFNAHKLAGTAGTFGFPELGDKGAEIEIICEEVIAAKANLPQEKIAQLKQLIDNCRDLAGLT